MNLDNIPTDDLIKELKHRFPIGFVIAYITDDPSISGDKNTMAEQFSTIGPPSAQRGLADNLADYIEAFNPINSGSVYFDDEEDDDDYDDDWRD